MPRAVKGRGVESGARRAILSGTVGLLLTVCLSAAFIFMFGSRHPERVRTTQADAASAGMKSVPRLLLRWQMPSRSPKEISFSPDSKFIGFVDKGGTARCYDTNGILQWSRKMLSSPHGSLVVGQSGNYSIACSFLNPAQSEIYFIGDDGDIVWKHRIDGSPWSAAASPDGNQFVVGSGKNFVYVYTIGKRTRRYQRWRIDGVPVSIRYSGSDGLLIGSWQDAGVGFYGIDGSDEWVLPGDQDKLHFVQTDEHAESILDLAVPNRRVPYAVLTLMDRTGAMFWRKQLEGYEMKAALSRTGRFTAIGYMTYIEHKGKQIPERRVALFDDAGRMLWDKGGMFFKPRLLGVTSGNSVLAYDEKFLYILDSKGKVAVKENLAASITGAWIDPFAANVAVTCANGRLYYYAIQ